MLSSKFWLQYVLQQFAAVGSTTTWFCLCYHHDQCA